MLLSSKAVLEHLERRGEQPQGGLDGRHVEAWRQRGGRTLSSRHCEVTRVDRGGCAESRCVHLEERGTNTVAADTPAPIKPTGNGY